MVHSAITMPSLHVMKAAEMKGTEIFFPTGKGCHADSQEAVQGGRAQLSPWELVENPAYQYSSNPLPYEAAHLYSSNPLPQKAAMKPKCLLLNTAPALQTDRRAQAVLPRGESSLHTLLTW